MTIISPFTASGAGFTFLDTTSRTRAKAQSLRAPFAALEGPLFHTFTGQIVEFPQFRSENFPSHLPRLTLAQIRRCFQLRYYKRLGFSSGRHRRA